MVLRDWLRREGVAAPVFARRIGRHVCTVRRWCAGVQQPRAAECDLVREATGGAVTADDFVRAYLAARAGRAEGRAGRAAREAAEEGQTPIEARAA